MQQGFRGGAPRRKGDERPDEGGLGGLKPGLKSGEGFPHPIKNFEQPIDKLFLSIYI